jgi:hypothetical protein
MIKCCIFLYYDYLPSLELSLSCGGIRILLTVLYVFLIDLLFWTRMSISFNIFQYTNHMSCSRPPLASGISGTLKLEVVTSKVLVTTMSWLTVTMTTDVLICSVCRNHSPVLDVFVISRSRQSKTTVRSWRPRTR